MSPGKTDGRTSGDDPTDGIDEAGGPPPGTQPLDGATLAERVRDRAGELVKSVEASSDHLVQVVGIPDLLGEALTSMREVVGLEELLAVHVVDRTDMGEGLETVHLMAVREGGAVLELRTPHPPPEEGALASLTLPSSVLLWRSAEWKEREAWELSGVLFEGHPGLSRLVLPRWWVGHPLRRDGTRQRTVAPTDVPLTPGGNGPEGEGWTEVVLPHGPMGGRMGLVVREKDGKVTGAKVTIGAFHRGVEGLCEGRPFEDALPLLARTAVRSSVHWQVAYAESVELLAHVEVPSRGRAIRVALMELERIADHMLAHASLLDTLGCPAAAATVWADREIVMDAGEMVTGQRLVQDAVTIGGVAQDAPTTWSRRLTDISRMVQGSVHEYVRTVGDLPQRHRLEGLVHVHPDDMLSWGLSGPMLRAAGVGADARVDGRSRLYQDVEVPILTRPTGDAMACSEVRLLEMSASAKVINRLARSLPGGRVRAVTPELVPKGSSVGFAEGPRGLVICHVVSDGTDRPRRVHVGSPDMAHASALDHLLLGCPVADVPLAVASIDLCVGGIDR